MLCRNSSSVLIWFLTIGVRTPLASVQKTRNSWMVESNFILCQFLGSASWVIYDFFTPLPTWKKTSFLLRCIILRLRPGCFWFTSEIEIKTKNLKPSCTDINRNYPFFFVQFHQQMLFEFKMWQIFIFQKKDEWFDFILLKKLYFTVFCLIWNYFNRLGVRFK